MLLLPLPPALQLGFINAETIFHLLRAQALKCIGEYGHR